MYTGIEVTHVSKSPWFLFFCHEIISNHDIDYVSYVVVCLALAQSNYMRVVIVMEWYGRQKYFRMKSSQMWCFVGVLLNNAGEFFYLYMRFSTEYFTEYISCSLTIVSLLGIDEICFNIEMLT